MKNYINHIVIAIIMFMATAVWGYCKYKANSMYNEKELELKLCRILGCIDREIEILKPIERYVQISAYAWIVAVVFLATLIIMLLWEVVDYIFDNK